MHERIKMLRKYLNLTQQAFAGRIGLKQNSIALIESGKRNISNQAILGICREFRVNEQWLRTGEGEMFVLVEEADAITAFIDDLLCDESARFKRRLIRVLSELSEKEWSLLELRLRQITGNADIEEKTDK